MLERNQSADLIKSDRKAINSQQKGGPHVAALNLIIQYKFQ